MAILGGIVADLATHYLQTVRALGQVRAGMGILQTVDYLSIAVQGSVLGPDETEASIERVFLRLVPHTLRAWGAPQIRAAIDSFRRMILEGPSDQKDEFMHAWASAVSGDPTNQVMCSGVLDDMLRMVDTITVAELMREYELVMRQGMSTRGLPRKKIVTKYFSCAPGLPPPARPPVTDFITWMHAHGFGNQSNWHNHNGYNLASWEMEFNNTRIFNSSGQAVRHVIASTDLWIPTAAPCANLFGLQQSMHSSMHR